MPCQSDKGPVSLAWGSGVTQQLRDLANVGFTGDRLFSPMFVDEKWAPWEGSVMSIDPSGRGKDETGYAVVKQLHGTLFCSAVGGLLGGYDEPTLVSLAQIAKRHQVNYIIIEANFGDGMFTNIFTPILTRIYPCTTEEVKHNIQKEKRIIDVLEPVINRHRLVVDLDALKSDLSFADVRYSLLYQLTHITRERGALKHDDRLDALSIAVSYCVDSMARDDRTASADWKNDQIDAELRKFVDNILGTNHASSPKWA